MKEKGSEYQRMLWEEQHSSRGKTQEGGPELKFTPNETAVIFESFLPRPAKILEVGVANGRDARHWALKGHEVIAIDFSQNALAQLNEIAIEQGVSEKIKPVMWDISAGHLPDLGDQQVDGFYARSALHIDDEAMQTLAEDIDRKLKPGGIILIEGKGLNDEKIKRSKKLDGNMAIDEQEGGHLRRIWTREFFEDMCSQNDWNIEQLHDVEEMWKEDSAIFTRLIAKKDI